MTGKVLKKKKKRKTGEAPANVPTRDPLLADAGRGLLVLRGWRRAWRWGRGVALRRGPPRGWALPAGGRCQGPTAKLVPFLEPIGSGRRCVVLGVLQPSDNALIFVTKLATHQRGLAYHHDVL